MRLKTAYARKAAWVNLDCETCGARYGCRVEDVGTADDTFVPYSDESLKEMALWDLEFRLQHQATRIPCPQCGSYPQSHADQVKRTSGRVTAWVLFVLGFIALVALVAKTFPTTPSYVMVPLAMVSWIGARVAARVAAEKSDPNLDLERNRTLAQGLLARGLLRTLPPAPPSS